MTRSDARVSGDLVLSGPGVRHLALRVDGSVRAVRLHLPGGAALTDVGDVPLDSVARSLARAGVVVDVLIGRLPVLRLGEPTRPVRPRPLGMLYALLTTPPGRIPALVRAGRALLRRSRNG